MKLRVPSLVRSLYWKAASLQFQIDPWEALSNEFSGNLKIALVGNAGYLLTEEYGRKIDDCDVVIRMNNFRLEGYQRQIGSRVDLVMTNFSRYSMVFDHPDLKRSPLLVSSRPMNFLRYRDRGIPDRLGEHVTAGMMALNAKRVFVPGLAYFGEQTRRLGQYPTTGLMALCAVVDFLSKRCRELFLTGFSFFEGRSHYFSDASIDAARFHNLDAERLEFQRIIHQHRDWINVDPIMQGYLESKGVVEHVEQNMASSCRIA